MHMYKHIHMYTVVRSQSVNSSVTFRIRFFFFQLTHSNSITRPLTHLPAHSRELFETCKDARHPFRALVVPSRCSSHPLWRPSARKTGPNW